MIIDKAEAQKRAREDNGHYPRCYEFKQKEADVCPACQKKAAAILQAVQDTALECAEIVSMADISNCGGYKWLDYMAAGRTTLRNAKGDIRRAYSLEEQKNAK